jgi:tryptophan-rich sensory protein
MKRLSKLIISILLCEAAGAAGSSFTAGAQTWYRLLKTPSFTPPSWLFAPVWVLLYFLMGIAAFLVWERGLEKPEVRKSLAIFLMQLLLNAVWSPVFFGLKNIGLSVAVIVLLWLAVLWTIRNFLQVSRVAGLILIPYLCWVSFAAALNIAILGLNR